MTENQKNDPEMALTLAWRSETKRVCRWDLMHWWNHPEASRFHKGPWRLVERAEMHRRRYLLKNPAAKEEEAKRRYAKHRDREAVRTKHRVDTLTDSYVLQLLRKESETSRTARMYGVTKRTVRNWRNEGAPLADEQKLSVWLAENKRQLPVQPRDPVLSAEAIERKRMAILIKRTRMHAHFAAENREVLKWDERRHWGNHPLIAVERREKILEKARLYHRTHYATSPKYKERQRIYYQKNKSRGRANRRRWLLNIKNNFPERYAQMMEKHNAQARARYPEMYARNREKFCEKARLRKLKNPEKERARFADYRRRNRERLRIENKAKAKRAIESLSDAYVIRKLRRDTNLSAADIPPELIALKRVHIQAIRKLRKLRKPPKQNENPATKPQPFTP